MSLFRQAPRRSLALRSRFVGAGMATLFLVAACGTSSTASPSPTAAPASAPASDAAPSTEASATPAPTEEPSGDLMVYYAFTPERVEPLLAKFMEAYPKIKAVGFNQPSEELVATLELETTNGTHRADVLLAGSSGGAGFADRNGDAVQPFTPAESDKIIPELRSKDGGKYNPAGASSYTLAYNTKFITPEEAPKSYAELLDPKWKDKVGMADPSSAASVHPFVYQVSQMLQSPPFGWEYFKNLCANGVRIMSGHGPLTQLLISGERPVAINGSNSVTDAIGSGEPIAFNWPVEGAPLETSGIVLMKEAPNPAAAEAFATWLFTKEGQAAFHDLVRPLPVRSDVEGTFPDGSTLADIKPAVPDAVWIAENSQEQAEEFHKQCDAGQG